MFISSAMASAFEVMASISPGLGIQVGLPLCRSFSCNSLVALRNRNSPFSTAPLLPTNKTANTAKAVHLPLTNPNANAATSSTPHRMLRTRLTCFSFSIV